MKNKIYLLIISIMHYRKCDEQKKFLSLYIPFNWYDAFSKILTKDLIKMITYVRYRYYRNPQKSQL